MHSNLKILLLFLFCPLGLSFACQSQKSTPTSNETKKNVEKEEPQPMPDIVMGAARFDQYLDLLKGKKVACLVNQTSTLGEEHVVDALLAKGITIQKIFAPEHGFRGEADAGEKVKDGKDAKTGIPLISLYGKKRKPGKADLAGLDYVVFDIQDVGARFYTYISSMSYVMEACAENEVKFLVLDRPNPNGHYVDGPVLKKELSSFIGLHEIPVVHGMTVGEYAQMVNEEGWLGQDLKVDLKVIPCLNYNHSRPYELPIKPSPNLPNNRSIYLYPSLCFFEGTTFSAGRGTNDQFQIFGHPDYAKGSYEFTPVSMPGAKYPKHQDKLCKGETFTQYDANYFFEKGEIDLSILINAYQNFSNKSDFFLKNNFFDKLAGSTQLKQQIIQGQSADAIRTSWAPDLEKFKDLRRRYLLYPDFE